MLTAHRISRLFALGQLRPMLHELLENGLETPSALQRRLEASPASAIALGLRRALELTYAPTSETLAMAASLESWRHACDGDPLATALAAAALDTLVHALEERPTSPSLSGGSGRSGGSGVSGGRWVALRDAALAALAAMQADDGLFLHPDDHDDDQRAMTAAFITWQLAGCEEFHNAIRVGALFDWFDRHQRRLPRPTQRLWSMARAGVQATVHLPNLAA